jgi:hypothetical protein
MTKMKFSKPSDEPAVKPEPAWKRKLSPGYGVFESGSVYTAHAIAHLLGKLDYRWVIRNFFHAGLIHCKIGNEYLTSGDELNRWVRENSKPWTSNTKSSDVKTDET